MSSFDQFFQQLMGAAAAKGSHVLAYVPVTVNVNFGQSAAPNPATLGRVPELARPPHANPAWNDAEKQENTPKGKVSGGEKPEDAPNSEQAPDEANFRGTVGRQTLIDKAVKLGFRKDAGIRLWNLLNTSEKLRDFCKELQLPFPLLGTNDKFRRVDLRELARLEGITGVSGFGSQSQTYKVLYAL